MSYKVSVLRLGCYLAASVLFIIAGYSGARADLMGPEDFGRFGSDATFKKVAASNSQPTTQSARKRKPVKRRRTPKKNTTQVRKKATTTGPFFSFFDFAANQPQQTEQAQPKRRASGNTTGKAIKRSGRSKAIKRSGRSGKLMATLKSVKPKGLPLSLAAAVVTVESNWRVNARGAAGERGLMQLMPGTARMLGVRGNLYDPRINMRAGTRYLYQCYRRAKGNVAGTIGCYNLGPGRMWAWNKNPITRRYVSRVRSQVR